MCISRRIGEPSFIQGFLSIDDWCISLLCILWCTIQDATLDDIQSDDPKCITVRARCICDACGSVSLTSRRFRTYIRNEILQELTESQLERMFLGPEQEYSIWTQLYSTCKHNSSSCGTNKKCHTGNPLLAWPKHKTWIKILSCWIVFI